MSQTVKLSHDYCYSPAQLWAIVIDYGYLTEVMHGLVSFTGMPEGVTEIRQKVNVKTSLFAKLPAQDYYMEILECDHESMTVRSFEKGSGVKSWRHSFRVVKTDRGCRLIDEIVIDAGLMTWLFCIWARYMYRARHEPRLHILKRLYD